MKVQLGEIRFLLAGLASLLRKDSEGRSKELPVKTLYWMRRAAQQLQAELAPFEETRKQLIEQHGIKGTDGQLVVELRKDKDSKPIPGSEFYPMTDEAGFQARFNELASEWVEIKYEPITIEQLGDITLDYETLENLGRLIKPEEED